MTATIGPIRNVGRNTRERIVSNGTDSLIVRKTGYGVTIVRAEQVKGGQHSRTGQVWYSTQYKEIAGGFANIAKATKAACAILARNGTLTPSIDCRGQSLEAWATLAGLPPAAIRTLYKPTRPTWKPAGYLCHQCGWRQTSVADPICTICVKRIGDHLVATGYMPPYRDGGMLINGTRYMGEATYYRWAINLARHVVKQHNRAA